ncbi:large ribosomal subunit protein uL23-like isoform X2 [Carex rostrata]
MAMSLNNTISVVNAGVPSCLNWRAPGPTSLLISCPPYVGNKQVTHASTAEGPTTTENVKKPRKIPSIYQPKKRKGLQGPRNTPPPVTEALDPFAVLKKQLITESAMKLMQYDNTLVFLVNRKADKFMIRDAIQKMYEVHVESVNTLIRPDGKKKAFIKLTKDYNVSDVASRAGII